MFRFIATVATLAAVTMALPVEDAPTFLLQVGCYVPYPPFFFRICARIVLAMTAPHLPACRSAMGSPLAPAQVPLAPYPN